MLLHFIFISLIIIFLVEVFARVLLRPVDRDDETLLAGCAQFLSNFLLVPAEEIVPSAQPILKC